MADVTSVAAGSAGTVETAYKARTIGGVADDSGSHQERVPNTRIAKHALKMRGPTLCRKFPTSQGAAQNPSNIRQRVLAPAVKRANDRLEKPGRFRCRSHSPRTS
jgi:hypothetical protein